MNAGIYITVWVWVGGCRYLVVGRFVWKTVPCRCMLIAFFICFGTVFQTVLFCYSLYPETASRVTWIRVLHGWLAQRGNKYGIISKIFETYEKVKSWFFAYFCSTNQSIIKIAKSNYKLKLPTPIRSVFNF